MFYDCILSCVGSGRGSDILLTTDSGRAALECQPNVLVQNLLSSVQASEPSGVWFVSPGKFKVLFWGKVKINEGRKK